MSDVVFTKMSSKGQIVVPKQLRKLLGFHEGEIFALFGENDTLILKRVEMPAWNRVFYSPPSIAFSIRFIDKCGWRLKPEKSMFTGQVALVKSGVETDSGTAANIKLSNLYEKELEVRINEIKHLAEELFTEGAYLEALEQFKLGRDLLLNLKKEEEAHLISELISGIEGLIEEREKRLDLLKQMKIEGNSIQIFELYLDIIEISKKLRDPDTSSFYQSELIRYFQNKELNSLDLEMYRVDLDQKANSLFNNNLFEMAAQIYEKCEKISQLLVQLGKKEEITNLEKYKNKKIECLKKF